MSNYVAWAGVVVMILVAIIGGRYALAGQRAQNRTQERVSKMVRQSEESRLALDMAIQARDRLDIMEDWEDTVREWWDTEHRPRDELRESILRSTEPGVMDSLPPLTPMPRPKRRKAA